MKTVKLIWMRAVFKESLACKIKKKSYFIDCKMINQTIIIMQINI